MLFSLCRAKSINATFDTIAQLAEQVGSFLAVVLNCAGIQQRMLALDYPEDDCRLNRSLYGADFQSRADLRPTCLFVWHASQSAASSTSTSPGRCLLLRPVDAS